MKALSIPSIGIKLALSKTNARVVAELAHNGEMSHTFAINLIVQEWRTMLKAGAKMPKPPTKPFPQMRSKKKK